MIFTAEERTTFGLPDEEEVAVLAEKHLAKRIKCGLYDPGTNIAGMPEDCLCLIATCANPQCAVVVPPLGSC